MTLKEKSTSKETTKKELPLKKKYAFKDFLIDVGCVLLALVPSFLYGGVQALFGWDSIHFISLFIVFTALSVLLYYRPFAGLYFSIINMNIIMIIFSVYYIYKKRQPEPSDRNPKTLKNKGD